MRKAIGLVLASGLLVLAAPMFASADHQGGNDCTHAAQPGIPLGSTQQPLGPVDNSGVVWGKQTNQTSGELGAKGAHGWFKASGDVATGKGRIEGRSADVPLNGYISLDGANSKVCVSANGTKVKP